MDSGEIEQLVNELETRVDRLRSLYEQYFMGIEKMIPSVPHKDVDRRIHILRKEQIRNTAVRFRFQMILQRYNTYQTHWQRICRQIEEGTYKRHRLMAERKFKAAEAAAEAPPESVPESVEVTFSSAPPPVIPNEPPTKPVQIVPMVSLDDVGDLDAILKVPVRPPPKKPPPLPPRAAPAAPSPPAPAAPAAIAKPPRPAWRKVGDKPAPAPVAVSAPVPVPVAAPAPAAVPAPAKSSPADLPDARLRQIYSQYVQTRRAQNESTASLTYDSMAKSLRESSAKLREKHGKSVDFEVTVKDGKTILKPVVKKNSQ